MSEPAPQPGGGRIGVLASILELLKGLTLTNALVIALLVIVAIPAYLIYQALNDAALLDRMLSSYSESTDDATGCTIRSVKTRGGPKRFSISAGFAFQRSDSWAVSVVLPMEPDENDIRSYCAALGLIIDKMLFGNGGHDAP